MNYLNSMRAKARAVEGRSGKHVPSPRGGAVVRGTEFTVPPGGGWGREGLEAE